MVVHDHDLQEVVGVGLNGQGGQGEVESVLATTGGDDDAHRKFRCPAAGGGGRQRVPVVAEDPGGDPFHPAAVRHPVDMRPYVLIQ